MKKEVLLIVVCLLVIVGCTQNVWKNRDYTFSQGFADLAAVDKEYNASFKQESLNKTMVPLEAIDGLLEKLEEMQKNIEKTKESEDKEALLLFIEIRRNMIVAEKNFQLAKKIGDIGLVTDKKGFSCSEARYILDTAYYYNLTFVHGRRAVFDLDDLLYQYRDVPQVQDLVGLDENKTAFYKSPFDDVNKIITMNQVALEKNCKIRVVTKEAKDL